MSTVPDPLNSTTNPFISGAGGTASQKHYQELTFSSRTPGAGSFILFNAYATRVSYPTMYKNLTGVMKSCRKGTMGWEGDVGDSSTYRIIKNGVLHEQITTPNWSAGDTTISFTLANPLLIQDNDEITVLGSHTPSFTNAGQYITLLLEWDGDLP